MNWARDRLAELDSIGLFRGAERDIDHDYGGSTPVTTTERLAEQVTDESQALDLFNVLRNRFDWSGTVFIRQDARDAVAERLTEVTGEYVSPDTRRQDVETLTDQLMESYEYRKLEDRFAELGNTLLADAAADLIPEEEL